MASTGTITTYYVDSTGVDLGKQLIEKDYLITLYPNLIPNFKTAGLFVWGENTNGRLGDNSVTHRSSPIQTIAAGNNWTSISSGARFALGIKSDGTLWTWGFNTNGELGTNTTTHRSSPGQTSSGGTTWKSCAAGYASSYAIKTDSTLWTWGLNDVGQLGDNTTTSKSVPAQEIFAATTWSQCSAGFKHASAIKTDGTLWCWGLNDQGQLGDDSIINKISPMQTKAAGTNWSQTACGLNFTMAIKTDGTLWGWGLNSSGQLGDNSIIKKSSPVQTVAGGTNWKQIACGSSSSVAIKKDGTLWCWGKNSPYGTLAQHNVGATPMADRSSPIQTVSTTTNWRSCSAGYDFMTALKTDGTVWCWGKNSEGQLGDQTILHRSSPVQTKLAGTTWKTLAKNYPKSSSNFVIRDFDF